MAEPKQEVMDPRQWLRDLRRRGLTDFCHTQQMEIYCPLTAPNAPSECERIERIVSLVAGGATSWNATGKWCETPECPQMEEEPVRVIRAAHSCMDIDKLEQIVDVVADVMRKTSQKVLGISVSTNKMYGVPTENIRVFR